MVYVEAEEVVVFFCYAFLFTTTELYKLSSHNDYHFIVGPIPASCNTISDNIIRSGYLLYDVALRVRKQ